MKKFIFFIPLTFLSLVALGQSRLNKPLVAVLDTIHNDDQTDRSKIDDLQKKYGWQSEQMKSLWKTITEKDSINLIKIKYIIDTHGWLGTREIGKKGARTIFLVIQHADSLTQVTYLPVMRIAVNEGKARPQDLALLEDRILTKQGKEQIYGSQLRVNDTTGNYEFYPIQDEINVNKRRKLMGLERLEKYAKHFNIEYVLPKSKK